MSDEDAARRAADGVRARHQGRKQRGDRRVAAGNASSEIDAAEREQVCWQQVLARFMRDAIDREWSFARPNRKHLWRGLYLPGPVEIDGGRFVVAIDTSGSMSDAALAVMRGEIDAIRRTCACELTVIQFDAAIHATAEFSRWNDEDETIGTTKVMRVYGRGGSDLRLPFTWSEEERRKGRQISALIVCTDGYGPLPSKAPAGLPVLFVLTPEHSAPAFGEQLVLGRQYDGVSARQGGAYSSPAESGAQAGPAVAGVPAYGPSRGTGRSSHGRMI
jgi:predicted metal-dependent peptidase